MDDESLGAPTGRQLRRRSECRQRPDFDDVDRDPELALYLNNTFPMLTCLENGLAGFMRYANRLAWGRSSLRICHSFPPKPVSTTCDSPVMFPPGRRQGRHETAGDRIPDRGQDDGNSPGRLFQAVR
jgi:hypothetical protein